MGQQGGEELKRRVPSARFCGRRAHHPHPALRWIVKVVKKERKELELLREGLRQDGKD